MKIKYFEAELLVGLETGYHYCLMEDPQGLENWKKNNWLKKTIGEKK